MASGSLPAFEVDTRAIRFASNINRSRKGRAGHFRRLSRYPTIRFAGGINKPAKGGRVTHDVQVDTRTIRFAGEIYEDRSNAPQAVLRRVNIEASKR